MVDNDSQAQPGPQAGTSSSVLDLDTIEREAEAATSAPWTVVSDRDKSAVYADGHAIIESENHHATPGWKQQRGGVVRTWDADFIASARTNVPALCKELREARAEIERLRAGALDLWAGWVNDGWDRADDDVRDLFNFTSEEQRGALNLSGETYE